MATSTKNVKSVRKSPHGYTAEEDISILKEVVLLRPFGTDSMKIWEDIFEKLELPVAGGAALKRHFDGLLTAYKSSNAKSLKRSGTEEDYTEKMKLLETIRELEQNKETEEGESIPEANKKKINSEKQVAQKIRRIAMEGLEISDDEDSKRAVKKKKVDLEQVLEMRERESIKLEKEKLEMKKNELESANAQTDRKLGIEERRLVLEEEKFQLQMMEYLDKRNFETLKREMEVQERKMMFQMMFQKSKNDV